MFWKKASDENKQLVEGKTVYLEKDVSEIDKFGRLLKYAYLFQPDGSLLMINNFLVEQGYAKVYTYPPDVKYPDKFLKPEQEVKDQQRGLWSKC